MSKNKELVSNVLSALFYLTIVIVINFAFGYGSSQTLDKLKDSKLPFSLSIIAIILTASSIIIPILLLLNDKIRQKSKLYSIINLVIISISLLLFAIVLLSLIIIGNSNNSNFILNLKTWLAFFGSLVLYTVAGLKVIKTNLKFIKEKHT